MKITLARISHNKRLSEETHAYAADILVDGVKVAEVTNAGHGGSDHVRWLSKTITEASVEEYIKTTLPPMFVMKGEPYFESLESVCANLVNDWLALKDYKRMTKTKVACAKGDQIVTWNLKCAPTADDVAKCAANPEYADWTFLNGLSDDELTAMIHAQRANDKATRGW